MTTRRQFIRGAVSAAVAASLPGGDGVELYSTTHPGWGTANSDINAVKYTYKTYGFATEGTRMHEALARSMMQTKEIVAKNVLERMFPETDALRSPLTDDLFVEIPEVHRS